MSSVILKCNGKKSSINHAPNNYYAEMLLCQCSLAFAEFAIPLVYQKQFSGRLSVDRGPVRLWRACPPLFLSAVFLAEWRTGGLV